MQIQNNFILQSKLRQFSLPSPFYNNTFCPAPPSPFLYTQTKIPPPYEQQKLEQNYPGFIFLLISNLFFLFDQLYPHPNVQKIFPASTFLRK